MSENGSSPPPLKVLWATPSESHLPWQSHENHKDMAFYMGAMQMQAKERHESPRYEFSMISMGRFFTPVARELICLHALKNGFDYVFMTDDDMLFPRDTVFRLLAHRKDIVGALAFTRKPPHTPVMYLCHRQYDPILCQEVPKFRPVFHYPKNALVRCDAIGFGAVLIHTRVLKKVPQQWFAKNSARDTGEDILFCLSCARYGFDTYMDTSTRSVHLGEPPWITEEVAEASWKTHGMDIERENAFVKYEFTPLDSEAVVAAT